jgi:hypothetical protein
LAKKRIIYIIGAGRSGTTLLDIILGNQEQIFSAGELNRFTFRRGVPTEFAEDSERYLFWKKIKDTLSEKYDLAEYDELQHSFEHHRGTVNRLLGRLHKNEYQRYQQFVKDYYDLLFNSIEEPTLVDSSKYPGRALTLSETLPDYDIVYIYLRRDPVGVVHSFAKKDVCHPSKEWIPANLYYFAINNLCRRVLSILSKNHKCVSIRYEDLRAAPLETLAKIEKTVDIDLSTAKSKINSDAELDVGNLFEGNRIRIPYKIKLMRGEVSYPATFKNRVTRLINGWLY